MKYKGIFKFYGNQTTQEYVNAFKPEKQPLQPLKTETYINNWLFHNLNFRLETSMSYSLNEVLGNIEIG